MKRAHPIILFALLTIAFAFTLKSIFNLQLLVVWKYIFSQILFIFIPGYVLGLYIFSSRDIIDRITISYALGYAINIIEYFIVYVPGFPVLSIPLAILVTLVSFRLLFKNKGTGYGFCFHKSELYIFAIFILYLYINVIAYSANCISPISNHLGTNFARDAQFWAANAAALKISYPPATLNFLGGTLFYHYFSSLHIAFLSKISGLSIFDLSFTFFPFGKCILFVGSLNYLLNVLKFKKYKWFVFLIFLFMSSPEKYGVVHVTYVSHTISCPFGFDIGLSFAILYVAMLINQHKNGITFESFICSTIFFAVLAGAKGPIAAIALTFSLLLFFIWLIIKREFLYSILHTISIISFFLLISIKCIGINRINSELNDGASSILRLYQPEQILRFNNENIILNWIDTFIYYIYHAHEVFCIISLFCFITMSYLLISKRITFYHIELSIISLITALTALMIGLFYNAGGGSEMYFTMSSYIFYTIFNVEMANIAKSYIKYFYFTPKLVIVLIISLLSLHSIHDFLFNSYNYYGIGMLNTLLSGKSNIQKYPGNNGIKYGSISYNEVLACVWIKENTDKNDIIVSNFNKQNNYYYGIFTERQQYLETDSYLNSVIIGNNYSYKYEKTVPLEIKRRHKLINSAYNNDKSSLMNLKDEHVQYMIYNKLISEGSTSFSPDPTLLALVYENEDVRVYKFL